MPLAPFTEQLEGHGGIAVGQLESQWCAKANLVMIKAARGVT